MSANINIFDGSGTPLKISEAIVDTNIFVELFDPKAQHTKEASDFITSCQYEEIDLYITPTIEKELMHITQKVFTLDYALYLNINPNKFRFKQLQSEIIKIDPNYFSVVAQRRDSFMEDVHNIVETLPDSDDHTARTILLQNRLGGVIETNDVSILVTASDYGINTIVTADYGYSKVDNINVIAIKKGEFRNHSSSNMIMQFIDITK